MSQSHGDTKRPPAPSTINSTSNTAPFNEYDDIAQDDLPPAYDEHIQSSSPGPISQGRPPQGPPPLNPRPNVNASSGYPGAQYHAGQWPMQQPAQYPPFQGNSAPFNYPPGYFCPQCRNTGIKMHNGHPCGTCERNFGRQSGHVQPAPYGMIPMGGVTYMAGDPRIGGRLCGNCKGHGIRSSMFGLMEEQCLCPNLQEMTRLMTIRLCLPRCRQDSMNLFCSLLILLPPSFVILSFWSSGPSICETIVGI